MDRRDAVLGYYDAIDAGDDDRLYGLLASGFVQHRPDRTLDGRDRFVRFMREERPRTDTEHVLEEVVVGDDDTVFARGRLRAADGDDLFGFVDVFRVADGRIESLTTYTD
ncbi:nuclear transport factor 2 family protein [Haloplanus litoreus]|uniref:Nuclear transport factor 2 family protein n=1 Tax=Haloplanus litoreus TaxID=767515 RepID=A0ABD5ZW17_9EURY